MKTKIAVFIGLTLAVFFWERVTNHWIACRNPWVFFDLGDTVIDVKTTEGKAVGYIPGAHDYIKTLRQRGYKVGIISNVPDSWGPDHRSKVKVLKHIVEEMWKKSPENEPMDWSDFSDALIFVPPMKEQRKPAPYLFKAAINEVVLAEGDTKCPVVFEGDDPEEVAAAVKSGMKAHLVGKLPDITFMPFDQFPKIQN